MGIQRTEPFERGLSIPLNSLRRLSEEVARLDRDQRVINEGHKPNVMIVVPNGPPTTVGGPLQPDFCDCRYWVKSIRFDIEQRIKCGDMNEGAPLPSPLINPAPTDYKMNIEATEMGFLDGPIWAQAIHLGEVFGNTHTLSPGTIAHVTQIEDYKRDDYLAFTTGGGGGGGGTMQVVIDRVLITLADADGDQERIESFVQNGPHIYCFEKNNNGGINSTPIAAWPNQNRSLSDFRVAGGGHIWEDTEPLGTRVSYMAHLVEGRWTLQVGDYEEWVSQPTSICGGGDLEPGEGACCLPGGGCQIMTAVDCDLAGGTHHEGSTCAEVDCGGGGGGGNPGEVGACCLGDGLCVQLNSVDCAFVGGSHNPGMSCEDAGCGGGGNPGEMGACCLPGGGCVQMNSIDCAFVQGTHHPGMSCGDAGCA